ncbi:MAG: NADH-quinone oxidoreductase subunit NuoG [Candidatus Puniceispirillales bacterium]
MITLTVDGKEVEVEEGSTVLQACEAAGKEVPRFCYHERLSIAGNCRMCLVEMERSPKPVASCAMPAGNGMVIKTDTPLVKKAREGVMEFMLINHPLDCPICDQGGECDLQDQAMGYGHADSRYQEEKRAVENKNMGPLISTIMTRCIHCTRCVRFATEVAGVPELGAIGRGEGMEITTYLEKSLASELSGNVVDLCPVGALTSRPYAYKARSWELTHTSSIDVMDAVGSHIRVDTRGNEVMRILPRINDDINEEWISDKTRHHIDGLMRQRIDRPYMRGANGRLAEASWDDVFTAIHKVVKKTKPQETAALAGDLADAESMFALKSLMEALSSPHMDCRQDGSVIGQQGQGGYLFNSTIAGLDDADVIFLIGANPRHEAAVLNARIRQNWLNSNLKIFRLGAPVDLTYPVTELGDDASILEQLASKGGPVVTALKRAKRPMIILGASACNRKDSAGILAAISDIAKTVGLISPEWNGFNILHHAAARVAGLMMEFLPASGGKSTTEICSALEKGTIKLVFNLGADEVDLSQRDSKSTIIYIGSHGDRGASQADIVLPGAAWSEKDGIYANMEGRVQHAQKAAFPPGDAREDWAILRALSAVLNKTLPFDDLDGLREKLCQAYPVFANVDCPQPARPKKLGRKQMITALPMECAIGSVSGAALSSRNFYMTCPISRASVTMAECVKAFDQNDETKAAE